MHKILIALAIMASGSMVFASKARVKALQGAVTTPGDVQDHLQEPAKLFEHNDFVTFEFGNTGTTFGAPDTSVTPPTTGTAVNSPNAEGGIARTFGNSKMALYLGPQSESLSFITEMPSLYATLLGHTTLAKDYQRLESPFQFSYATKTDKLTWGAALYYAASEVKMGAFQNKKSAQGVKFSILADKYQFYANLGLNGQVDMMGTGTGKGQVKMKSSMKFGGQYNLGQMMLFGSLVSFGGKVTNSSDTEIEDIDASDINVGVESGIKKDAAYFFYGAGLNMRSAKNKTGTEKKIEGTYLPLYFGLEAEANSWLALRGTIKQYVLIGSTKVTSTGTDASNSMMDSTAYTGGASLRFNKNLNVDFMLSAASGGTNAGKIKSDDIGSEASLTYMF